MAQESRQLKAIEVVLKKGDERRSRAANEGPAADVLQSKAATLAISRG